MVGPESFWAFAMVSLGVALTPGPNMLYLITRSMTQGRLAGFISLLGVILGFVFYMLSAAFGLAALLLAVPLAFEAVRWAGAAYLLYLAWETVRPGARPLLERPPKSGMHDRRKLFLMGLATNMLNPKIAVLYMSLLPQFLDPSDGRILIQSLMLGSLQIAVSFTVNLCIVVAAGTATIRFRAHPIWLRVQRWATASVLAALAVRLALEKRTT
ncbi:LysE family translocator [Methylobacterium oxalidis]|uniref:LysE family translocator n=1 Tax=Methylobacterium oxalidis TaxID=944322 RepID=UPI0033153EE9